MTRVLSRCPLLTAGELLQKLGRQQGTGALAGLPESQAVPTTDACSLYTLSGFPSTSRPAESPGKRDDAWGWRGMANKNSQPSKPKRLTVKTTTKSHRFSHYIKADREVELRKFWQETRQCSNPAFLQRYINFSRIYARFRDMDYLPHTMRDWDAAISRLFDHDRGKQPANDLVRKHPYLLNVKIIPLQFAKNAVKGKLPLYDWRLVLRDLRTLVGEDVVGVGLERKAVHVSGRRAGDKDPDSDSDPSPPHFSDAKKVAASWEDLNGARDSNDKQHAGPVAADM